MSLIKLNHIHKTYDTGKIQAHILRGVSLEINDGEFVAIMGPSGSGKSTLMNILGFLDVPTQGQYHFDGQKVDDFNEETLAEIRNEKMGFVFQQFYLLPRMNALENVKLPMIYAHTKEVEQNRRATKALHVVGLENRMDHKPNELSGGQQQRVAIARSLVNNPKVILADEPTGNLDTASGKQIMNIFTKLNKEGKTIIMVTHESYIAKYANRTICIKDGEIEKICKITTV